MNVVRAQPYLIFDPNLAPPQRGQHLSPERLRRQRTKLNNLFLKGPTLAGNSKPLWGENEIIKADQFPALVNSEVPGQDKVEGAPNYRKMDRGIVGTAQPTVAGIKEILRRNKAHPKADPKEKKKVVWTNLREEPVVYINGRPFNLRHKDHPYENRSTPGRSADQIAKDEKKLKQEILERAKKNGEAHKCEPFIWQSVEVETMEGDPPKKVTKIEKTRLPVRSVQTVDEVYFELKTQGYNVEFQRVPVTDTKKPADEDVDALVSSLKKTDPDAVLVFNCHAGKGRTTTASVLAALVRSGGKDGKLHKNKAVREDIKEQGSHNPREYRGILSIIHDLIKLSAHELKLRELTKDYSQVVDLKKAVQNARKAESKAKDPKAKEKAKLKTQGFQQRYNTLVLFNIYVREHGPEFKLSFSQWKKKNPNLSQVVDQLSGKAGA